MVALKAANCRAAAGFDGFYRRRHLAPVVDGKAFKHMLRRKGPPKAPVGSGGAGETDQPLMDARARGGFEEEMDAKINGGGANEE